MISGNRSTLALRHMDYFSDWACENGYVREETKGYYEVLRLRPDKGGKPLIYFKRAGSHRRHASCQKDGLRLVYKWFRERGEVNYD